MKVEFLRDFRGVATAEQFYERGTVVDLPDYLAHLCLAEGAVSVVSVPEVPAVETGAAVPSSAAAPVVTISGPVTNVVITNEIKKAAAAARRRSAAAAKKAAK